jgi:superfamily II DNA/RNA helicase
VFVCDCDDQTVFGLESLKVYMLITTLGCLSCLSSALPYTMLYTVSNPLFLQTQRGVGAGSTGFSVSLIASGEDKNHARIVQALQARFEPVHLDGRLLTAAQERVNLASKVVADDEVEQRRNQSNKWYQEQAAAVGFDIEDDMYEDSADKDQREQGRSREAKTSKAKLRALLSQPMVAQRYGKFLSTSKAVTSMRVAPLTK